MRKAIIGLSGGMDSVTLLGYALSQGYSVHCVSFLYGSKHSPYEMQAANNVVAFYNDKGFDVSHNTIDLRQAFQGFKSNLLSGQGEIPEGHYEAESMKQTVVPGRNLIMSSIMAGLAESMGAEVVMLGVHSGDHHIYPDCRESFIGLLNDTVRESSEGKVSVWAPFLHKDKHSILKIGYSLTPTVPYALTRTCYKDQKYACGKCGSCQERLEAFEKLGIKDPVIYEDQIKLR